MQEIMEGLPGVLVLIDDVVVFGKDQDEHNSRLTSALKRLEEKNVTLNAKKCEFHKASIGFLGHIIDSEGVRADPVKTAKCPLHSLLRSFAGLWAWQTSLENSPTRLPSWDSLSAS